MRKIRHAGGVNLSYVPRRAERLVQEALGDTRVVTINGARQVGKSTLAKAVLRMHPGARERRLDVATEREAAISDPTRFVRHEGLLAIDEVQRVPDLMLSIKAEVDEDPRPGRFLLTGSARLLGLRGLPDALVGRMETIELWPFSQGELERVEEQFIDRVFDDDRGWLVDSSSSGTESRDGYIERSLRGGFPEAVGRVEARRSKFFESYVNDLIDRDVTQLAEIERRSDLRRFLQWLAGSMAQPIKVERLASQVGLSARTAQRYLTLFEEVFLVKRLEGWSASVTGRAQRMRKLVFVDSGLGAHLLGLSAQRIHRSDNLAGPLVENFVLGELARQLTWSDTRAELFHYRTRDHVEVDAVLQAGDGRIVGIEIKAAETARRDDFSGLRHLQARLGDRFCLGLVLHAGKTTASFGDRLVAAPIDLLWR